LTAVGRVAAISVQIFCSSTASWGVAFALLRFTPSAMPIAAATPIAGAPRITIVRMALATSCGVRQRTYSSCDGSFRWSTMITTSSCQSIVGSIFL
jgi:hypothetical protein